MTLRPEIAELIAAGFTDTGIAARLGIDRTTANRARAELRRASQFTALTAAPPEPPEKVPTAWTSAEQAAHRADLLAALDAGPHSQRKLTCD
ncbi:helix-turn-helix domain-containing protein [Streptomyces sp. NPDC051976]|uniref:helix-turn-helix domain-containing protein n=1 Tax=Streptomyces sp. NPDC051976 TaxID=3154947 RepID=UPI00343ABE19